MYSQMIPPLCSLVLCAMVLRPSVVHATGASTQSAAPSASSSGIPKPPRACPQGSPADCDERLERYRALGLPDSKLAAFLRSDLSLTAWYNREHIGGRRLRIAGWIIFGLGALTTVIGIAILIDARVTRCNSDNCDSGPIEGILTLFLGIPFTVAGVAEMGIGLPMALVGERRMRRWVKDDWLDRAPIDTLREHHSRASRQGDAPFLLPFFAPGGGGLSLSLRF